MSDSWIVPGSPTGPRSGEWYDQATGLDGPALLERVGANEQARIERYGRGLTVVEVEIVGLDAFASAWGRDVADALFATLVRTLRAQVRTSDWLARIGAARFRVLLIESDEIAAINFVERVRAACDAQLPAPPDGPRIGLGWAGASRDRSIMAAVPVAQERLAVDLRAPR